jgi:hypothetical protein
MKTSSGALGRLSWKLNVFFLLVIKLRDVRFRAIAAIL